MGFDVGIVGATGAVGIEIITCLEKKKFPVGKLRLFASSKSSGKQVETSYGNILIEEFSVELARQCDFIFLAVSGEFALEYAIKISQDDGPYVIDNSSAFRYMPEIPLVVNFNLIHLYSYLYIITLASY
jgi:aspartate-semialdehyde dehydrogenase